MEREKLPNAMAVLILGILSIVTCCCYGLGGVLGIVALVLAKKDLAIYQENPERYSGYQNLNTGRILSIIGIVLSVIYLAWIIYAYVYIGEEGLMEIQERMMQRMQQSQ